MAFASLHKQHRAAGRTLPDSEGYHAALEKHLAGFGGFPELKALVAKRGVVTDGPLQGPVQEVAAKEVERGGYEKWLPAPVGKEPKLAKPRKVPQPKPRQVPPEAVKDNEPPKEAPGGPVEEAPSTPVSGGGKPPKAEE